MHADFTGGIGSMVWLGLAWLPRGWGVEADRYTYAFRCHLEIHGHAGELGKCSRTCLPSFSIFGQPLEKTDGDS